MMWNDCNEMCEEFEPALKTFLVGLLAAAALVVVGWWTVLMLWATLTASPTSATPTLMADEPMAESSAYFAAAGVTSRVAS
jgi:hypothetical protein